MGKAKDWVLVPWYYRCGSQHNEFANEHQRPPCESFTKQIIALPKIQLYLPKMCHLVSLVFNHSTFPPVFPLLHPLPDYPQEENYVTGKKIKSEELRAALLTKSSLCEIPKLLSIPQLPSLHTGWEKKLSMSKQPMHSLVPTYILELSGKFKYSRYCWEKRH